MATRNNYDYPTDTPVVDERQIITTPWGQWVNRTHTAALSIQNSGTTADRPDRNLWIGRFYFDTTLGKPIWVKSVPPKPAAAVWCDATGLVV